MVKAYRETRAVSTASSTLRTGLLDAPHRAGGKYPGKAGPLRLKQSPLQGGHAPHLAGEPHLAHHREVLRDRPLHHRGEPHLAHHREVLRDRPLHHRGVDREHHREIQPGVGDPHPPGEVDVDVKLAEPEPEPPLHHRERHVHPPGVEPLDHPLGRGVGRAGGEGLDL